MASGKTRWLVSLLAVTCMLNGTVRADDVGTINTVRARGCAGMSGVKRSLKHSRELDLAAERLGAGDALHLALKRAKYRAVETASIHLRGAETDASLRAILRAERWCRQILNPALLEAGSFSRGGETWLVFAAPFTPPSPSASETIARRALKLVNDARAQARRCGFKSYAAAAPVKLSEPLNQAALAHSRDMAKFDYFDHPGHDGTTPAQRVAATGYRWSLTGENIASGMTEVDDAIAGWIQSPGHCANLMNPKFTEMGIGYAASVKGESEVYWTQVFATPR